ncbi:hypothetical protein N7457_008346 [Penicillium paradoxum]|uniref:uncharacterized protein n=1 Tax=Penicillium paradoxum TaxID=176176 RepID=UPI002546AEE4|nr:uncharacterized protein N7457_008346 [Penicillium paradoxum]KAJ5773450.1 hypothetical protein N7457_008346 [Penicillium paradoxum]
MTKSSAAPANGALPKSFNAGTITSDDYRAVGGFAAVDSPVNLDVSSIDVPPENRRKVIIVGSGVCGMQQATSLLRDGKIKHKDMQIFDALSSFGGVWEKNKYPGCALDVPGIVYTTSYYISKTFSHFFARREELVRYYTDFANHYELGRCTQFDVLVTSCIWDEDRMVWHVAVQGKGGKVTQWMADVVIHCTGALDRPKFGNTPGRELFKGDSWHTAYWPQDYDLTGKSVGIIGCGPSVAQIVPEIVDKTKDLTIYMRTPPFCIPRGDYKLGMLYRFAMSWVPYFPNLVRGYANWAIERIGMQLVTEGHPLNDEQNVAATKQLENQVKDPILREKLRPTAKYFCKRPLWLDTFYPAVSKPNCYVAKEDLVTYTETGVISKDKETGEKIERNFDVIIYGTGFNTAQHLDNIVVRGAGGVDLQAKWKAHPEALYGMSTSEMPNMFMVFGPNTVGLWCSQQDLWQAQAELNSKFVTEILKREKKGVKLAVSPKRAVEKTYNLDLQEKQAPFAWSSPSCVTYFRNDEGWNTFNMHWSYPQWRNLLKNIKWDQWETFEKPVAACQKSKTL